MRLVIADTGPINYLTLIGDVEVLPVLFEKVILPTTVKAELISRKAPESVRAWLSNPPAWLEIHNDQPFIPDPSLEGLDEGEKPPSHSPRHSALIFC